MKKIAVIYYSGTGHTALQAKHVAKVQTISGNVDILQLRVTENPLNVMMR